MKSLLGWFMALVFAAGLLISALHAGNQINAVPLRVGVVDLFKVVEGYQKKKDREAEINQTRDMANAQLKELQKKIEGMAAELELLDKNSPLMETRKKALLEKQEELLMKTRLAEREVRNKLEQYLQEVYNEVLTKIVEYREQNNLDFLFRVETRPLTLQESIMDQLDRKLLMAHAKCFDVTDDVIAFLNKSYTK